MKINTEAMRFSAERLQYSKRQLEDKQILFRQNHVREIRARRMEETLIYNRNAILIQTHRNHLIDVMA